MTTLTKARASAGLTTAVLQPADYLNLVSAGLALYNRATGMNEFVNSAFASLHGYVPMELKEISGDALVSESDRAEWLHALESALLHGRGFSLEVDRLRKDGSCFPSFVKITPDKGEANGRYLVEVQDRSEQRNMTKALNEDRHLLLNSFQQLPVPLLLLNTDLNRVLSQSNAFCSMFPNPKELSNSDLNKAHRAIVACVHKWEKEPSDRRATISANETGMVVDIILQITHVTDHTGTVMATAVVITRD